MTDSRQHKQYRIGTFARRIGVTADFLKHYEEAGLIAVEQRESGYRYYPFDQSARIIEYMRLRNYGIAVKDMRAVATASAEAAFAALDAKADEIGRTVSRLQAMLEEHERLRAWLEKRRRKPID